MHRRAGGPGGGRPPAVAGRNQPPQPRSLVADLLDDCPVRLERMTGSKSLGIAQRRQPQGQIDRRPPQRIAVRQQRRDIGRIRPRQRQHMRQPGMQRQPRQRPPMIGDPLSSIQGLKRAQ